MKNFKNFEAEKYVGEEFKKVEEGIYLTKHPFGDGDFYVTSLTFEHEPDQYGEEDGSPQNITQTPLEDLLDEHLVAVTDFYDDLNEKSESICYLEFGSGNVERIQELRNIIGKRFIAIPFVEDGVEYYNVAVE